MVTCGSKAWEIYQRNIPRAPVSKNGISEESPIFWDVHASQCIRNKDNRRLRFVDETVFWKGHCLMWILDFDITRSKAFDFCPFVYILNYESGRVSYGFVKYPM